MTILETILREVQSLPLREQVEVVRYVHRLAAKSRTERAAKLHSTHGALNFADGEVFEAAMKESRTMVRNG